MEIKNKEAVAVGQPSADQADEDDEAEAPCESVVGSAELEADEESIDDIDRSALRAGFTLALVAAGLSPLLPRAIPPMAPPLSPPSLSGSSLLLIGAPVPP